MPLVDSFRDRARARVGTVLLDKWQLDALLGVGGTAAVYAATHRNGRRVAIKILRPELAAYPDIVTRFVREGYIANQVDHPNVVAVMDDDVAEDGASVLVMELLDGSSLERFAKSSQTALPMREVLRIGDELLDVLAVAHDAGVVHRDIKPANIFVTRTGVVKVLDFGIARLGESIDSGMTQTGTAIGTPGYMPPEQARGRWSEVDARTDLWAVGATLYALLAGGRPRRGETVQEELLAAMTSPLPPIASMKPGLPSALCAFIDKSVAFERHARFADARSMQYALKSLGIDFRDQGMTPSLPYSSGYPTDSSLEMLGHNPNGGNEDSPSNVGKRRAAASATPFGGLPFSQRPAPQTEPGIGAAKAGAGTSRAPSTHVVMDAAGGFVPQPIPQFSTSQPQGADHDRTVAARPSLPLPLPPAVYAAAHGQPLPIGYADAPTNIHQVPTNGPRLAEQREPMAATQPSASNPFAPFSPSIPAHAEDASSTSGKPFVVPSGEPAMPAPNGRGPWIFAGAAALIGFLVVGGTGAWLSARRKPVDVGARTTTTAATTAAPDLVQSTPTLKVPVPMHTASNVESAAGTPLASANTAPSATALRPPTSAQTLHGAPSKPELGKPGPAAPIVTLPHSRPSATPTAHPPAGAPTAAGGMFDQRF